MKLFRDKLSGWTHPAETKEKAFAYFSNLTKVSLFISFAGSIEDVEEVETPFNPLKEIDDGETYVEHCEVLLDSWLERISTDRRYTRPVTEQDEIEDENADFLYTDKGSAMVERAISRLTRLGEKHFGPLEYSITSPYYKDC